jgi:formylglycine-generating enzyme required for sulfatase activity
MKRTVLDIILKHWVAVCLIGGIISPLIADTPSDVPSENNTSPIVNPAAVVYGVSEMPSMLFVKGGVFTTGADPLKSVDPNTHTSSDFWMSQFEITFKQFDMFCQECNYYTIRYWGSKRPFNRYNWKTWLEQYPEPISTDVSSTGTTRPSQLDPFPATHVCWLDAMAYCLWLSEKYGISCRLPTQAEWEYVCMSGKLYTSEYEGEVLNAVAWYKNTCNMKRRGPQIHRVGTKQPNVWGFYDMLGNVWEWCMDGPGNGSYQRITTEWQRVRKGLTSMDMNGGSPFLESTSWLFQGPRGAAKALRGGAYCEEWNRVTPTYRMYYRLNYRASRVGFRIVTDERPPWLGQLAQSKPATEREAERAMP